MLIVQNTLKNFAEKTRFHSHKDKTQFSLLRIVIEDSIWTWSLKWRFGICQRLKKRQLYFSRIRYYCPQQNIASMDTTRLYPLTRRNIEVRFYLIKMYLYRSLFYEKTWLLLLSVFWIIVPNPFSQVSIQFSRIY